MKIIYPCENYTEEKMASVIPPLIELGFERICAHRILCEKHREFKDNTAYFFCQFENMREDGIGYSKSKQYSITTTLPMQQDFSCRHPYIKKDGVFSSEQRFIGWYNRGCNVLWLSDIFHRREEGEPALLNILLSILQGRKEIQ